MNKKTIVAVLGLCALVATPAFAQQPAGCDGPAKECRVKDKDGKRRADAPNPFEGLNLSADQQTKLDALKKECRANREAQAKQRKEAKAARKEGACKARAEQLAKIKEILTPEQYVKFLENSFLKADRKFDKKFDKQGRKGDRGPRPDGPRGQRPDRQPKAQ